MDSHVFRLLALELAVFMSGGRVEKVHSPAPGLLCLSIFNHGLKRVVVLRHRKTYHSGLAAQDRLSSLRGGTAGGAEPALYLTERKLPNPQKPSTLVMTLRKHIQGHRLGAVAHDWVERRIFFGVPQANSLPLWLCLDLIGGPSLHLELPEIAAPVWPNWNDADLWRVYPVLTPLLRKSLAALAVSDPLEAAALLGDLRLEAEQEQGRLYCYALPDSSILSNARQSSDIAGVSQLLSAWPLPPQVCGNMIPGEEIQTSVSAYPCLEAARQLYEPKILAISGLGGDPQAERETVKSVAQAQKRLERTLLKLDQEELRLRGLAELRRQAIVLQSQLWRYAPDERLDRICLNAQESPDGQAYEIKLDPLKSVRENMAELFRQSDRGVRGLAMLADRRGKLTAELAELREGGLPPGIPVAPAAKDKKVVKAGQGSQADAVGKLVQRFVSSDGFVILRGRSALGNQAMLKVARPHDIWLHVQGGPSAHVLIRRDNLGVEIPDNTLREAAMLSAVKSWRKAEAKAEVITALARDVRPVKGGAPGSVLVDKLLGSLMVPVVHGLEAELANRAKDGKIMY
ncbi:MAG: NFACT RNA binding domain-containing protein [Deltaproteobacteria bacterium]|nr:NFACT RNA binding domain-containing protein [Deltaproteobacteria bacterium]